MNKIKLENKIQENLAHDHKRIIIIIIIIIMKIIHQESLFAHLAFGVKLVL